MKDSHCSYCGQSFPVDMPWPRTCPDCGNVSYRNPLPVSVVLLPVDEGLLLIRRTNAPQVGKLALPGGFINVGESWQEAGARELWEETGIRIGPAGIRLYDVQSAPDGTVLIFGLAPAVRETDLPPFVSTNETSESVIAQGPMELAFPTHIQVAGQFWKEAETRRKTI